MSVQAAGFRIAAGQPLLFAEVGRSLSAAGIPKRDEDATPTATAVISAPADWLFSTETCWYVREFIEAIPTDSPLGGRHYWMLSKTIRLACAHRRGCVTEVDHKAAIDALETRFTEVLASVGTPRKPRPHEFAGLIKDGINTAAAKTDEEAHDELGGHPHDDWMMTMTSSTATTTSAAGNGSPPNSSLLDSLGVDGEWLDKQQFNDLEYAVDGIIPEGLGVLVAPPKKGKSFLVADVGLAVAAGRLALGSISVTKRPVLYLALEDGHRRLQNRFRRILRGGSIPKGIELITKATPVEAVKAIEEFMTRHAQTKPLVILDTLGKVKPGRKRNQDAYQADYEFGTLLKNLADKVPGSTLLVVHHTRKAEANDFVDSVSGTNGVAGSVDFVLVLDRKRLANDAILSVTGRDVIEAEYALIADEGILWRLDGADLKTAAETVEKRRLQDKVGDRLMEVYQFVFNAKNAVTATDVANGLKDMDGDTAGKYLRRLKNAGHIVRLSRGQYMPAAPVQ